MRYIRMYKISARSEWRAVADVTDGLIITCQIYQFLAGRLILMLLPTAESSVIVRQKKKSGAN